MKHINQIRAAGHNTMARSSVAICGLARDCAANLESMIPQVEMLGSAFSHHRIIVVENDSSDDTGSVLSHWSKRNDAVRLIRYCYTDTTESDQMKQTGSGGGWFGEKRMQRMAFARNLYLEALHEAPFPDYVIVIDLDISSFSMSGIEHSFGLFDEWDVISANGMRYSIRHPFRRSVYWDSYAYEPIEGFPNGIQTSQQIRADQTKVASLLNSAKLLAVRSAFGGLSIYRSAPLATHRYSVVMNGDPDIRVLCDHPTLHRSIREQDRDIRFAINPLLKVRYGSAFSLARESFGRLFNK